MAAPAKSFTVVPDANLAVGKPGLSADWLAINGNTQHLEEWLGKNYTAAVDHNHDGVNSAAMGAGSIGQTQIANGAVHQGELSTSTNTVSTTSTGGVNLTTVNTEYLFYPLTEGKGVDIRFMNSLSNLSKAAHIYIKSNAGTVSAYFRYINSSPPHRFHDSDDWGMFLYLHLDKNGEVISTWSAPDPVWGGNMIDLPKNHPARIKKVPHPFLDVKGDESVVLVDLRHLNEEIEIKKEQQKLTHLISKHEEFISLGCTEAELTEHEEIQQLKATKEQQEIDEAKERIHKITLMAKKDTKLEHIKRGIILKEKKKLRLYKKHELLSHQELVDIGKNFDRTLKDFGSFRIVTGG